MTGFVLLHFFVLFSIGNRCSKLNIVFFCFVFFFIQGLYFLFSYIFLQLIFTIMTLLSHALCLRSSRNHSISISCPHQFSSNWIFFPFKIWFSLKAKYITNFPHKSKEKPKFFYGYSLFISCLPHVFGKAAWIRVHSFVWNFFTRINFYRQIEVSREIGFSFIFYRQNIAIIFWFFVLFNLLFAIVTIILCLSSFDLLQMNVYRYFF